MKHKEILSRAWSILWSYKVLWFFGIILALTTTSFPDRMFEFSGSDSSNQDSTSEGLDIQPGDDIGEEIQKSWSEGWQEMQDGFDEMGREFERLFSDVIPAEIEQTMITLAIVAGCVIFILIILGIIFRYVSESAIVQLVDEYEAKGTQYKIREGFRKGFSRSAWHVFLINLVIDVPIFLAFVILFLIVLSPALLWMTESFVAGIVGTVTAVGLFFLVIFLAIIVGAGISLLKRFIFRQVALVDVGPIEAIKLSFSLVRRNFKDVILMWLIMVGIGLGFALVMIPIGFLLLALSAIIGGALGLSVGGVASFFTTDTQSIIAGVAAGAPVFLLLLISPLAFLSGLKETYFSTTWTLTYREVVTLDALEVEVDADLLADDTGAPPELEDSSQA